MLRIALSRKCPINFIYVQWYDNVSNLDRILTKNWRRTTIVIFLRPNNKDNSYNLYFVSIYDNNNNA